MRLSAKCPVCAGRGCVRAYVNPELAAEQHKRGIGFYVSPYDTKLVDCKRCKGSGIRPEDVENYQDAHENPPVDDAYQNELLLSYQQMLTAASQKVQQNYEAPIRLRRVMNDWVVTPNAQDVASHMVYRYFDIETTT